MNVKFDDVYTAHQYRIIVSWAKGVITPASFFNVNFGEPTIHQTQYIIPQGFNGLAIKPPIISDSNAYISTHHHLNVSWTDQTRYKQPKQNLSITWAKGFFVFGNGFDNQVFGTTTISEKQQIAPTGFDDSLVANPIISDSNSYLPTFAKLDVSWLGQNRYNGLSGRVVANWSNKTIIYPNGFDGQEFGTPNTIQSLNISPKGFSTQNFGKHYALHHWQSAPIEWQLNATWLGESPLNIPPADEFYVAWFIPSGNLNIGAVGFVSSQVGTPAIINHRTIIKPKGFEVRHYFGQASVTSTTQFIKIGNLSTLQFGGADIKLGTRFVSAKGIDSSQFGRAWLSHFLRHIITQGNDHLTLGKHRLSHHTQFVRPVSIEKNEKDFASNHKVGGTQIIAPFGTEMTQWLTRIIPESQTIGITKGINGEFGTPAIENHTQYLSPKGFGNNDGSAETVRFGRQIIFNHTQYIAQYFIADSGLTPQIKDPSDDNSQSDFGKWTAIANRNKTITTFGADNSKFGYQQIDNKAVPVLPTSITGEMGKPMIAYRVRKLPLDGIEPPHFSYWHIIRNTARVLAPQGFDNQGFGTPSIESNLQTIKQIFPFESHDVGTPMIADRVRFVSVEWRHSIAPPTLPLPTIENHTRYITPKGFDGTDGFGNKFGRAELIERFNIIKAHGREHSVFGADVIIKNLTPEVRAFGHNSAELGTPAIRTQWREVSPFGNQMSAVGTPIIKDRKQTIRVDGVNGNVFGWHFVKKGIAPPYSTQYIELRRFDSKGAETGGFGIGTPSSQVPPPNVKTNVIAPNGMNEQQFGKHQIVSNGILVDSGIFEHLFGNHKVWINQQFIRPKGIDHYIGEQKMGKPQLSPYTIYAPSGDMATTQARRNHLATYNPPMDMQIFGRASISNRHRTVKQHQYHVEAQTFGRASIKNKNQIIKPYGFRGGYFGWHMIPFVPQSVEQFSDKPHKTAFGTHTIGFTGEQQNHIRIDGLSSARFGVTQINHFHRTIAPKSFVATQMGQSRYYDKPFMWQGLRIGERVLGNYGGFDSNVFGATWISNKIREVNAEGFDSFISEADIKSFKGRLTVKRAIDGMPKQGKQVQAIGAVAIAPPTVPVPNIKNKVHYIRPDGNSEQFRKGAW